MKSFAIDVEFVVVKDKPVVVHIVTLLRYTVTCRFVYFTAQDLFEKMMP